MNNIYLTLFYEDHKAGYPLDTVMITSDKEYQFHRARFQADIDSNKYGKVTGKYVIKEHDEWPETYELCA